MDNPTAVYGAVLATVTALWNIYQYWDAKPRLKLVTHPEATYTPVLEGGVWTNHPVIRYEVVLVNAGQQPTTVVRADLRWKNRSAPVGPHLYPAERPPEALSPERPFRIEAHQANAVTLVLCFETDDSTSPFEGKYEAPLVLDLLLPTRSVRLDVPFSVRTADLNYMFRRQPGT